MKLTSTIVLGAFAALSLLAVPACDDKKADDKKADDKDKKEEKKEDAKTDAKADEGGDAKEEAPADEGGDAADGGSGGEAAEGAEGGDGGGGIGVPECDDYVEKYTKCIEEKLPDQVKETSKKALETSVDAWKKAAATPAGKEGLAQACKTAAEAVKASCGW